MPVNAREICLEALLQVGENEGYSNIVLNKTLKKYDLTQKDKSLVSIIFYGVLEKKITLDYYIEQFLNDKRMKLSLSTQFILEMAVYQIVYLDKIPESAAVNESVNLAKKYKCPSGFINGVLRSLIRKIDSLELPQDDSLESLSIRHSVPMSLISMWIKQYGLNYTKNLLVSFEEKSKIYVRVNNTKIKIDDFITSFAESATVKRVSSLDNACQLISSGDVTALPQYEEGLFHVEDLSSQYLCSIINPEESDVLIDICAAPGGKTFTLTEIMNDKGKVYSFDMYKGRVNLIRKGAERLGLKSITALIRNAVSEDEEHIEADKVLCDVPCSGFGIIRRKPEIRYKSEESVKELPEIQYKILNKSAELVKKGGILVYSTCTLNRNENNVIADKFLKEHPEFEGYKIHSKLKRVIDEPENQLTIFPFANNCDGFFISMFKRK